MKIETHCHTGASFCADCPSEIIAKRYLDAGYNGIVVTNHIDSFEYTKKYEGITDKEKTDYYIDVYEKSEKVFVNAGLKCFFACEICVNEEKHSEYILYGITKEFLYKYNPLFRFTQKEMFDICNKENILMYKAHPFRDNELCGDPRFMHGAEFFNGHYHHNNSNSLAEEFCEKNGLIKMAGTDFHHADQPITSGIIVPDSISDIYELRDCIRKGDYSLICDKETYEKAYNDLVEKNRKINESKNK